MKKFEIHYVNFRHNVAYDRKEYGDAHLQDTKPRPCVILSTNQAVTTVAPLTSKNGKRLDLPQHLLVGEELILMEQIATVPTYVVDKKPFKKQFTDDQITELQSQIVKLLLAD